MKYVSVNKLSDFEFHDAEFAREFFDNNRLKVKVDCLNIHNDAEQNPYETDMQIESAVITFEEFHLLSYEPGREWKQDENGKSYPVGPQILLTDAAAYSRFSEQLEAGVTILTFGIKEGTTYFATCFVDTRSEDSVFTVCFTFKSVRVEWDEYWGEAWYVSGK